MDVILVIKKRIWPFLFGLYCALMLWLLFDRTGYDAGLPYADQLKYNLLPFETIGRFLRLLGSSQGGLRTHAFINLAGNVVMFIPLGFFLPKLWQKQRKLWRTLLTTALIILLVELAQMFTLVGTCDTDDLILNTLGAAIGYSIYKTLIKTGLSK